MSTVVMALLAVMTLGVFAIWLYLAIGTSDTWAIAIYRGRTPLELEPHPSLGRRPVISANDVTDVRARFVADPFMLRHDSQWYMFLEVLNEDTKRGEIAFATSNDALHWQYQRVVMREPFHLSYPHVFQWNSQYYMLPETRTAGAVRLYRARSFPTDWEFVDEILNGPYADPTIFFHEELWWLFAYRRDDSLTLHFASAPTGPWVSHPQNPIIANNKTSSRPAGKVVRYRGKLYRYAQDATPGYGGALRAFEIKQLDRIAYAECEVPGGPVLCANGRGWNAHGMHHADVHELADSEWLACVDGNRIRRVIKWRKSASRLMRAVRPRTS